MDEQMFSGLAKTCMSQRNNAVELGKNLPTLLTGPAIVMQYLQQSSVVSYIIDFLSQEYFEDEGRKLATFSQTNMR